MAVQRPIKVLIIDDSALVRQVLISILSSSTEIEVVGTAGDPYLAWQKIHDLSPDVLTLDIEMPRMDGLTFLAKLMRARPMPVVMVSSLTEKGGDATLRALELGAIDFISKPKLDVERGTLGMADEIVAKIKVAANAKLRKREPGAVPVAPAASAKTNNSSSPVRGLAQLSLTHKVVAIGASTGGTEAIAEVLQTLPPDFPGVVIAQHMPEKFTTSFARRLDGLCRIRVTEARDGDQILPGHALLAPGNFHMSVVRSGASYHVKVHQSDPVNRHRPSVSVLFESCASSLGGNALGIILTGMGEDGAEGLLAMRRAGAHTIAQDEKSCVVFGMPRAAIRCGGAEEVLPLNQIPDAMGRLLKS